LQVDGHYAEQARIKWMMSLGEELGGPERAKAMINAQGVSLILKSIEVQYKRIVTYPDTVRPFFLSPLPFNQTTCAQLLIGYRPLPTPTPPPNHNRTDDKSTFYVAASAFSLAQGKMVAHSKEALVWYNYDVGRKCNPGEEARGVVRRRMGVGAGQVYGSRGVR